MQVVITKHDLRRSDVKKMWKLLHWTGYPLKKYLTSSFGTTQLSSFIFFVTSQFNAFEKSQWCGSSTCLWVYYITQQVAPSGESRSHRIPWQGANMESSEVSGTSSLLNILIYLIGRPVLCGKCPKSLTIQYLPTGCKVHLGIHITIVKYTCYIIITYYKVLQSCSLDRTLAFDTIVPSYS